MFGRFVSKSTALVIGLGLFATTTGCALMGGGSSRVDFQEFMGEYDAATIDAEYPAYSSVDLPGLDGIGRGARKLAVESFKRTDAYLKKCAANQDWVAYTKDCATCPTEDETAQAECIDGKLTALANDNPEAFANIKEFQDQNANMVDAQFTALAGVLDMSMQVPAATKEVKGVEGFKDKARAGAALVQTVRNINFLTEAHAYYSRQKATMDRLENYAGR